MQPTFSLCSFLRIRIALVRPRVLDRVFDMRQYLSIIPSSKRDMAYGSKVIDKLQQPKPWSPFIQRTNTLISTFCNRTDVIDCFRCDALAMSKTEVALWCDFLDQSFFRFAYIDGLLFTNQARVTTIP
jgi:hypothetical protein